VPRLFRSFRSVEASISASVIWKLEFSIATASCATAKNSFCLQMETTPAPNWWICFSSAWWRGCSLIHEALFINSCSRLERSGPSESSSLTTIAAIYLLSLFLFPTSFLLLSPGTFRYGAYSLHKGPLKSMYPIDYKRLAIDFDMALEF
jgi:hypothetical protein